nr:beta-propeller fold lactonase family protein [Pseudoalteromonas denitrificans]
MLFTPVHAATFVYVGNATSNEISIHQLNPTNGDLSLVNKIKIPGVIEPGISSPMVISPDQCFLYIVSRGKPYMISSFKIDAMTGKLSHIDNQMMNANIAYISIDLTGQYLISASYPHHKIIVNPVSKNGDILKHQYTLNGFPNAHAVLIDKTNRYVLVPTLGDDRVYQFEFNVNSGKMKLNDPPYIDLNKNSLKKKVGPRHIVFHPNGQYIYVIGQFDASIHLFDFNPKTGVLNEKQNIFTLPVKYKYKRKAAADIHITPDGRFIYSSDRVSSTISGFEVDAESGFLTSIEVIETEKSPRGFNIDASGKYLLVVGELSNEMSIYRINKISGRLIKLKSYLMGINPNWVEIVTFP